jgi:phospholipid/cholesterol/gamma-HCH transport system ATP-binding protein
MNEKSPIISVKNLTKSFGSKRVLHNISFDVPKGQSLVVIGTSGTGKSVLLKNLIGLLTPTNGEVFIKGQNFYELNHHEQEKLILKIGVLFQGGALFDSLNIWQNVAFSLVNNLNINGKIAKKIAIDKLKQVGLNQHVAELFPSELSGGMQKRVALARAIATEPEIILFDEPTSGLDPINTNLINDLIYECTQQLGATTITITHDMSSVKKIADRVIMLHDQQIIWQGEKEEMETTTNKYIRQFIFGESNGPIAAS